jgi:hypothetical protein
MQMLFGRIYLVACAVVLLTAACTHGDTKSNYVPVSVVAASSVPAVTVPPRSSSRPTPSTGPLRTGPNVHPGEKPPVLDPLGKQHTPGGALVFAGYFVRALDWSIATTDPYLLRTISASTCPPCRRFISSFERLSRVGGHVRGGRIVLKSASLVAGTGDVAADAIVKVALTQEPIVTIVPSAAPSTDNPVAETSTSFVFLSWLASHWIVDEFEGR